ncbi:SDR family oxidoreductase [Pseudohaliea rubra]|uniref:Oxidoreductase, short-chain dehydrogenase/reductase family n=1 Tax=Pseudohaliea rubra DSM 19751 TaxID=1265313 RepID=A0A095XSL1_9GAMM|nr:SDR family oxidoreductase [Pseudohaliea rubra]KGE02646.1 oxidoreductase, short-chain dehydrogenase/reductase family [Pseudohaliea rubra DSM 19751]
MYPAFQFEGAVLWITGASSGIGAEAARQFARRGARLVLSARSREGLQAVCDQLPGGSERHLVLPLDIGNYEDFSTPVDAVIGRFGRLDLLFNNAGITQRSLCIDTPMAVYRQLMDVNVLGQIALTKAVLPVMQAQGHGHIAATASVAGKVGAPLRTGYCATKHALMGFFDALRTELDRFSIRVTTVVPGFIRTDIAQRVATADGEAFKGDNSQIENGMPVEDCVRVIVEGFEHGLPEIPVGTGPEMAYVALRHSDPEALFKAAAAM